MKEYIFTARDDIYIIDLQKTVKKLEEAYEALKAIAEKEGLITSSEGRVQAIERVLDTDLDSFDQLRYFWHHFDRSDSEINLENTRETVVFYNEDYQGILAPDQYSVWTKS